MFSSFEIKISRLENKFERVFFKNRENVWMKYRCNSHNSCIVLQGENLALTVARKSCINAVNLTRITCRAILEAKFDCSPMSQQWYSTQQWQCWTRSEFRWILSISLTVLETKLDILINDSSNLYRLNIPSLIII